MTDDTPDSELVSAYVDGEATAEEAARVEADPSLAARVEGLRALRDHLAVAPPAGLVDDQVAEAMAAFGDAPASRVTRLAPRRRPLHQRIPLGAIAAAVVVLALFGAVTQMDLGGSDDDDMAASGDDSASAEALFEDDGGDRSADGTDGTDETADDTSAERDAGATEGGAGADAGSVAGSSGAQGYFFAFSDTDDLADHIVRSFDAYSSVPLDQDTEQSTRTSSGERDVDPCDAVATVGVDPATVSIVLPAVVAGEPVTAVVVDAGGRRLLVVDDTTCSIIDDRAL